MLGVREGAADLVGDGGSGFVTRSTRTWFVSLLTEEDSDVLLEEDPLDLLEVEA